MRCQNGRLKDIVALWVIWLTNFEIDLCNWAVFYETCHIFSRDDLSFDDVMTTLNGSGLVSW